MVPSPVEQEKGSGIDFDWNAFSRTDLECLDGLISQLYWEENRQLILNYEAYRTALISVLQVREPGSPTTQGPGTSPLNTVSKGPAQVAPQKMADSTASQMGPVLLADSSSTVVHQTPQGRKAPARASGSPATSSVDTRAQPVPTGTRTSHNQPGGPLACYNHADPLTNGMLMQQNMETLI